MSQVVMYLLSMPARILFIFSGPEHYNDRAVGVIRFLMSLQWLCLGIGTGLAVAFVRNRVKRTRTGAG